MDPQITLSITGQGCKIQLSYQQVPSMRQFPDFLWMPLVLMRRSVFAALRKNWGSQ